VLGPGFITANVDNDSGGILTYSQAGAQYGYSLLWTMIPITISLIVVQEMCARMGVVTGKGLSDLIREEFGLRLTFLVMLALVAVNYTNVVTEFIGIAGSMHLFHVSKFISVPFCAGLVLVHGWCAAVTRARRKSLIVASLVYIAYIFAGVLSQPSWHDAFTGHGQMPGKRYGATRPTCIWRSAWWEPRSPRGCSSTCNLRSLKRAIRVKDYAASRLDVIVGSLFTDIVAWFIIVACAATLYVHGMGAIQWASDAAEAMRPFGRRLCFCAFCVWTLQRVVVLPLRFCRCLRRIPFVRGWDLNPA